MPHKLSFDLDPDNLDALQRIKSEWDGLTVILLIIFLPY